MSPRDRSRVSRPWRRRLPFTNTIALPLISTVLLLLVLALPELGPRSSGPEVLSANHARIVALLDPHRPDPSGAGGGFLPDARVLMLEGPQSGREVEVYLQGPGGQQDNTGYRLGEDVLVSSTLTQDGGTFLSVTDRWRLPQLAVLALIFVIAVVAAGGWRGLRALLALGLTIAVVVRILVPLIVQGVPPIPVAVVLGTVVTILTIGLTEGFSRASVAAILGTTGALALTALLAAVTIAATAFSNAVGSELIYLEVAPGVGLDLRGLLLAAFIFGAIGVLDDVTVTQAAAVEELVKHAELRGRGLFASAFNVGRSHIAATVNTLFLAYLGASLPLIVLFAVSRQPTSLMLNGEQVAIEIVRTLVGSLGIVAAVPFTTLIAVWLTRDPTSTPSRAEDGRTVHVALRRPAVALVGGLAVIGLVTVGAAVLMAPYLTSPQRTAVAPDRFDPSLPIPTASATALTGGASAIPRGEPPIVQVGAAVPVVDGPDVLGYVTVIRYSAHGQGETASQLLVEVSYVAVASFDVRPEGWIATPLTGDAVVGGPATTSPALTAQTLAPGQSVAGWLEFTLAAGASDVFLDYLDPRGQVVFIAALL
jgi:uncharacterized membrane protein